MEQALVGFVRPWWRQDDDELLAALLAGGSDVTAPNLSSASGSALGPTSAQLNVTSDEAGGTAYWVVTQSATTPSIAQVQAGQDHTGSAADEAGTVASPVVGVNGGTAVALVAETTYYVHWQQEDAAANDSTVVSSASFTTPAVSTGAGSTDLISLTDFLTVVT